jgi:non-specific serine/threonine protein kinase
VVLATAGELVAVRRWHAAHFLAGAAAAEPAQRGPEQAAWLDRLDAEHDNLRAALEWGLADVTADRQVPPRLAGALSDFWICRGHATEGRGWLDRALAGASGPPAALVKAHYGAGRLAHFQRDSSVASRHLQTALSLARDLGDAWAESWVLHLLARVA